MEIPKLCVFCEHFFMNEAEPGYSEWTPGSPGSFGCLKGLWKRNPNDLVGLWDYGQYMRYACKCTQFKVSEFAEYLVNDKKLED